MLLHNVGPYVQLHYSVRQTLFACNRPLPPEITILLPSFPRLSLSPGRQKYDTHVLISIEHSEHYSLHND